LPGLLSILFTATSVIWSSIPEAGSNRHPLHAALDLTRFDRARAPCLSMRTWPISARSQKDQFAPFSDADLITAMFSPRAA